MVSGIFVSAIAFSIIGTCHAIPDSIKDEVLGGIAYGGGFTTLSPDPDVLVWDPPSPVLPHFRAGWLNVPVVHDPYITPIEKSPRACLRVLMKPAAKQPAKLGPILLHCGGPGSDASCAPQWGKWLELNSSYLVGSPLSDDYDYWSISQRGMNQDALILYGFNSTCPFKDGHSKQLQAWPKVSCTGINDLVQEKGIEEVLKRLAGNPDKSMLPMLQEISLGADAQTFGVPFFNETYVRWFYRLIALENNLCFQDQRYQMRSQITNRSYNLLQHSGTSDLAYDIEVFRAAIGAKAMSIYGVSYGTKVGSVYATIFPDKVHRLILDGNMGSEPDVLAFAGWVGESTEAVWTGLAEACDNSVMRGEPAETLCPAGPGVTSKLHKIFKNASTAQEKSNAVAFFNIISRVIYSPGVPCAGKFMKCLADLYASGNFTESLASCSFSPDMSTGKCVERDPFSPRLSYPGTQGGLDTIASVLGLDFAGRLTEESFIQWWRSEKEAQPLGITRSLGTTVAVGTWPVLPRPNPPAGSAVVAPLVIGNLYDGQTPYRMAQRMIENFPSGRLLTSQFYGHGMQEPHNVTAVVERYENEMKRGVAPTYDDEVAKLLCVKYALQYLKTGKLSRDYVCKAAGPAMTGPGPVSVHKYLPEVQILV